MGFRVHFILILILMSISDSNLQRPITYNKYHYRKLQFAVKLVMSILQLASPCLQLKNTHPVQGINISFESGGCLVRIFRCRHQILFINPSIGTEILP